MNPKHRQPQIFQIYQTKYRLDLKKIKDLPIELDPNETLDTMTEDVNNFNKCGLDEKLKLALDICMNLLWTTLNLVDN